MPPRSLLSIPILFCALAAAAGATTVRSLSVGDLLAESGLVFEGRVIASEVRDGGTPTSIRTCVTFEVLEVLKGAAPGAELELCFAGGTSGEWTLHVAAMRVPETGETGVYFVEVPGAERVHPLHGWSQGHFRYEAGRVRSADGLAVVGVDPASEGVPLGPSGGVARGVTTAPRGSRAALGGLDPATFKALLRARLAELAP